MKSFAQAVDYVNNNQATWDHMINLCHKEWADDSNFNQTFSDYVLTNYGIKLAPKIYNRLNFTVVDSKKYLLFQIKFAY